MAGELPSHPTKPWDRWKAALCCLLLAGGILAVYWPVTSFEFINFDDPIYVARNPHVQAGLRWASLGWAWRATDAANWHPLTWISLMLDCQLHGLQAGKHHLTSVLLHVANACLLFLVWRRMTGRLGRSFLVAALFAWHPLRVESVAWISERKDVLSTFFLMLTLYAYVRYAEARMSGCKLQVAGSRLPEKKNLQPSTFNLQPWRYYCLALCFFALGLLSKPMLVSLPFLLMLLDYWPLGRIAAKDRPGEGQSAGQGEGSLSRASGLLATISTKAGLKTLLWEKAPFLLLAALSAATTLWVQRSGHAMPAEDALPAEPRFANAIESYYRYIGKMLWPAHLAVFYIYGHPTLSRLTLLGGAILLAVSVFLLFLRRFPYLPVGWFWYVGTLIPVIGLVQVGGQAMADRYTYIPSIGLAILAVFAISDLAGRFRLGQTVSSAVAVVLLAGMLLATRQQVQCWRNDETLYRHAIAVTSGNFVAYNNLGTALDAEHRYEEAVDCFNEAVRCWPAYADAYCNLASAYLSLKQPVKATAELQIALKLNPNRPTAHYLLANQLLAAGHSAEAAEHYRAALALKPYYAEPHYQLAILSLPRGDFDEAIRQFREAIRLKPDWIEALNNLSWLLATCPDGRYRDGTQALAMASQVLALARTSEPSALDTLAAAYAENGQYTNAAATARRALHLAQTSGLPALTNEITTHLLLYEKNQPYREAPSTDKQPK
jgi:tetratricopeptide (TPR) repeat protein